MNNIEQFAPAKFTEGFEDQGPVADINVVPTNYDGINTQDIDPATLSSNTEGPPTEAVNQQAADAATQEAAFDAVDTDHVATAPANNENPDNGTQAAGGVDPMLRDQSGYDAGFANGEGDGSAKYEPGNEMVDGVRNDYIGGYIRGFEEARAPQPEEYVDNGPPLGPENDQGPMVPGFDNGMEDGGPPVSGPIQTGGDGFRLGVDAEMVGGQAVVEGYDNEQATCGGYGEELASQVGGGSPFNFITDPDTNQSLSIFSNAGKALLKRYVKAYKQMQSGGAALLEGVDAKATGALYDGIQNAGAESLPGACDVTYDAAGPEWTHTQVGGGKKYKKSKSKRHSKKHKSGVMKKRPCGCNKGCKSCKKYGCDNDPRKCKCKC